MSCFEVQISPPSGTILEIETCSGQNNNNIIIEQDASSPSLTISQCMAVLPSDINDIIIGQIDNHLVGGSGILLTPQTGQLIISATGLQPIGNYSLVGHQHYISDVSGLQTALDSKQPTGIYASGIHYHTISDITNFNSGVSGLLPSISGTNYIITNFSNNIYTISTTGLQPSGNYSIVGHNHTIPDISGLQIILDSKQPSGNYASGIHFHISSDITDFNSAVSGLLTVTNIVSGTNIIVNSSGSSFSISATGLQPSGNYSVVGHTHISSDITNFDSSVSGLLPSITGNEYIVSSFNNNLYTLNITGLQPSGDYANSIHNHNISDIIGLSGILNNKQNVILNPVVGTGSSNHIAYWNSISGITYDDNQLYWDSSSNELGIGTNNPARNIDVVSSAGTSVGIKLNSTAIGGRSYSFFSTNNNSSLGGGKFGMYDDTAQASRFVIDGNGNIGIGTNSPSYKLEVVGTGNFTQNLLVNGVPVSISGHTHSSNDITNFNSAVSGLLPSLTGTSGVLVTNNGNNYIISLNDPTIQLIDITDLSENARVFLLTPSSNNLSSLVSDETGSGSLVFNTSPAFSGTPTVPTASSGTNTDQIASTAFVRNEISNLVDSAPSTLDTLNELAAALGDDPNFATTITNSLANKANLSGAIFTGSVAIPSGTGNFNSLSVNNVNVSVSGHIHTSSDITNFNSSVSGLLPTISNSGDNRILTSTGSSVGINAESNLTFNGSTLSVSGLVSASSGNFINSLQFNGINYLDTTTYIVARPGDNLLTKYNEAKALTPRGIAKSATNRASLIVMPGTYVLSSELTVDTQFVDIIGLGSQTKKPAVLLTTNTINVTANDIRVQGISVGDQNFKIADNKPLQIIENCVGTGWPSFGGYDIFNGGSPLIVAGTFIGCVGGLWSFGGGGTASGRFIDCEAGDDSFGGFGGIASGYFERCIGTSNCFGGKGLASGTFLYCTGTSGSFGSGGSGPAAGSHVGPPTASGVFKYCNGTDSCFGGGELGNSSIASGIFLYCNGANYSFGGFGDSTVSGTFKHCTAGASSFGREGGTLTGIFEYCTAGDNSFAGASTGSARVLSGTFNYCTAGDNSFGANTGYLNGTFNYCASKNYAFGAYIGGTLNYCKAGTNSFAHSLGGAVSGVLNNCIADYLSFGYGDPPYSVTITGRLHNCILSSGTFMLPAAEGKLINCIDGNGNVITIT